VKLTKRERPREIQTLICEVNDQHAFEVCHFTNYWLIGLKGYFYSSIFDFSQENACEYSWFHQFVFWICYLEIDNLSEVQKKKFCK
jgi:hypothetical protein